MPKELPSPELLRKLLRYDLATGKMYWLPRTPDMFSNGSRGKDHNCNIWNSRHSGTEAFTSSNPGGYLHGALLGHRVLAHRIAWAIHHGAWPCKQIDHINGVRSDNRIENLRDVTWSENQRNVKRKSTNTSGVTGVSWFKELGKWRADICINGKNYYLGSFSSKRDAVSAREEANEKYGYHVNHGRES